MAKIIWFTGLSGAGKTTISNRTKEYLKNKKCLIVDGDKFRKKYKQFSFSRKNIFKNNIKIINFCKKNFHKFDYILVSVISPLKQTRLQALKTFKKNYFEIYVFASKKVLVKRDTKGLYKLSKKGLIKNLIGFNSKIIYEKSDHKYLRINTSIHKVRECVKKVLNYVKI